MPVVREDEGMCNTVCVTRLADSTWSWKFAAYVNLFTVYAIVPDAMHEVAIPLENGSYM